MRGERGGVVGVFLVTDRFIPACAGNAITDNSSNVPQPVHPRMRGERCRLLAYRNLNTGSSPHARGTRLHTNRRILIFRFIPACAGNAAFSFLATGLVSVHPRMRGERENVSSIQN